MSFTTQITEYVAQRPGQCLLAVLLIAAIIVNHVVFVRRPPDARPPSEHDTVF